MASTIFDDRSPSIVYSAGWRQISGTMHALVFDGTTTATNTPGTNATLVFNGTAISVFGTVNSLDADQIDHFPPPVSSYAIDGADYMTFTANVFQNTTQRNITFFKTTGLAPNVNHMLVITMQNNGTLVLDWIQVHGEQDLSHGSDGHGGSSESSVTPGDIGGIVVGVVCFLCIIAAGLFYLVRNRKKKGEKPTQTTLDMVGPMESDDQDHHTRIDPFMIEQVRGDSRQATLPPPYSLGSRSKGLFSPRSGKRIFGIAN